MPPTRTRKTTTKKVSDETAETATPTPKTVRSKATHITTGDVIGALNSAVDNINTVFQLRDHLENEIQSLKEELNIGHEMSVEKSMLEELKKDRERFIYDFDIQKERLEHKLTQMESDKKEELANLADEHKVNLKSEVEAQTLKLKLEREDHLRKISREKEDWQRDKDIFISESSAFNTEKERFEERRKTLRQELIEELNRDNAHTLQVLELNHQKEIELIKGELKLEKANSAKYETMLKEASRQNEKLGAELTSLSKEALTSASTSSMAAKLKDIIAEMSVTSSAQRVS